MKKLNHQLGYPPPLKKKKRKQSKEELAPIDNVLRMENTAMTWQTERRRKEVYQKHHRKVVANKGGHNSGSIAGRK